MSNPVWGMLAKSQSDDETIEEAIDRLILAHEADEEAHLGVGESLQSHKASEIIDHLAESIVEDKLADGAVTSDKITSSQIVGKDIRTAVDVGAGVDGVKMTDAGIEAWQDGEKNIDIPSSGDPVFTGELRVGILNLIKDTFQCWFGNHVGWLKSGTITDFTDGCTLLSGAVSGNYAKLDHDGFGAVMDRNPFFQFKLTLNSLTSQEIYCTFGTSPEEGSGSDVNHIGWKIVNGTLYSSVRKQGTEYNTEISAITLTAGVYRLFTFRYKSGEWIKFYVNGVLVDTRTTNLPSDDTMGGDLFFKVKTNTSAARSMSVRQMVAIQDMA